MKFYQALEQWRSLASIGRKPRTKHYHAEIVGIIRRHWTDSGQGVETITREDLTGFAVRIAHYSAPRFNAIVSALKFITPAASLLRRRPVTIIARAEISQFQFQALIDELDRAPQGHGGLVIRFLAHTGLRINEARQLRWQDVRVDHIAVPAGIAKNGKARCIPFVTGLADALARLRAVTSACELVLPQAECRTALEAACARAGLPRLSHHDFRHLFATRCVTSGVDLPTVARWLGHSDGGALLGRVYFHLADGHSRKMASKVEI